MTFNDWQYPLMSRADYVIGGVPIVECHDMPKEHVADEIVRVEWPWWVEWPALAFGVQWFTIYPRRWKRGGRIEREKYFLAYGKLFISPISLQKLLIEAKRVSINKNWLI